MVTRRSEVSRTGKLGVESKDKMKSRGLDSPDRADAVMGCISCGGGVGGSWERFNNIHRPTAQELMEEATKSFQEESLPSGRYVGY